MPTVGDDTMKTQSLGVQHIGTAAKDASPGLQRHIRNLYARALIEAEQRSGKTIEEMAVLSAGKSGKITPDLFLTTFPGYFRELCDGSWLALNRYHNVLGSMAPPRSTDPENHRDRAIRFRFHPAGLSGVWNADHAYIGRNLYLYSGVDLAHSVPPEGYFERLARVLGLIDHGGRSPAARLQRGEFFQFISARRYADWFGSWDHRGVKMH
jgi:hypothetical protein